MVSSGLGALICEKFAAEQCNIAINYLSSEASAKEVEAQVKKHGVKAIIVQAVRLLSLSDSSVSALKLF